MHLEYFTDVVCVNQVHCIIQRFLFTFISIMSFFSTVRILLFLLTFFLKIIRVFLFISFTTLTNNLSPLFSSSDRIKHLLQRWLPGRHSIILISMEVYITKIANILFFLTIAKAKGSIQMIDSIQRRLTIRVTASG